jgi:tRNA threonylcarbamoyladenosine biosynthesis protein TsaE
LPEEITVATAAGMRALGARLAAALRPGDLVLLSGPLGAGKTTLAQGLGDALGVRGRVTSPTFVIARVHPSLGGGPGLVHVDAYRLGGLAEMDDLDLDLDGSVTVVEWGEGLAEPLSADRLEITIGFAGAGTGAGTGAGAGSGTGAGRAHPGPGEAGPGPGDGDEPRTVRVTRVGPRWAGPVLPGPVLPGPELAGPELPGPVLAGPELPGPDEAGVAGTHSARRT